MLGKVWPLTPFVSALAFLCVSQTTSVSAQEVVQKGPRIIYEDNHDTSPPVREMPVGAEERGRPLPLSLAKIIAVTMFTATKLASANSVSTKMAR
jgi:hypothetical protein